MGISKTCTFKMDSQTLKELQKFCDERGLKLGKFMERAARREIREERKKEMLATFSNLDEREKQATDYFDTAKKLGL